MCFLLVIFSRCYSDRKETMSKFEEIKNSLKRRFDETPEQVIMAGGAAILAVAKAAEALAGASSKRAYAKQINRKKKK